MVSAAKLEQPGCSRLMEGSAAGRWALVSHVRTAHRGERSRAAVVGALAACLALCLVLVAVDPASRGAGDRRGSLMTARGARTPAAFDAVRAAYAAEAAGLVAVTPPRAVWGHGALVHPRATVALDQASMPRTTCADEFAPYADFLFTSVLYDAPFAEYGCAQDDCGCAVQKLATKPAVCWPYEVPVWARRQAHYQYLADPDATYSSCQWRSELKRYLADPISDENFPLLEAKRKCMDTPECGGITGQVHEDLWTLRRGTEAIPYAEGGDGKESLVIMRGLCACECSKGPPTCIWAPLYGKRLSKSLARKWTCISNETLPSLSADDVQGPRCEGPPGKTPEFLVGWLDAPDDTVYKSLDQAKMVCQRANAKSMEQGAGRVCTGADKDQVSNGFVLMAGHVADKPGGNVFECEDPKTSEKSFECPDLAHETRLGCFFEKVQGKAWLSSEGLIEHGKTGLPASTCYSLDEAKSVCSKTEGCTGVNVERDPTKRCNCHGDIKWNLATGRTLEAPATGDAQASAVYVCNDRIGLPPNPNPPFKPYACPIPAVTDDAGANTAGEESGGGAATGGTEGGATATEGGEGGAGSSASESGAEANTAGHSAGEAGAEGGASAAAGDGSEGGSSSAGSTSSAGSSDEGDADAAHSSQTNATSGKTDNSTAGTPAPSPHAFEPPAPPPIPQQTRSLGDPRGCNGGLQLKCDWLPNQNVGLGGAGTKRKYTCGAPNPLGECRAVESGARSAVKAHADICPVQLRVATGRPTKMTLGDTVNLRLGLMRQMRLPTHPSLRPRSCASVLTG